MKLKNDIVGHKKNVYGIKGQEIIIISTSGKVHIVENVSNGERYGCHNDNIDYSENLEKAKAAESVPVVPQPINKPEKSVSTKSKQMVASPIIKQQKLF